MSVYYVTAKLKSYEDLEARMKHMEPLIQGHFDEKPDRGMPRAEWDAAAVDSAKKASGALELLRLEKNEKAELRANTKSLARRRKTQYKFKPTRL